ncbi:MAG: TIGR01459 family HAD-type hydrolase [Pseudomonadota bacterium]
MTTPQILPGLSAVSENYDLILCDVWGVMHNGRRAFPGTGDALTKFRASGGRVVLLTNAPVPKDRVLRYFAPLGVPETSFDDCASSGDATRHLLEQRPDDTIWVFGADEGFEHDKFLYKDLPNPRRDAPGADLLLCIGLRDQMAEHPEDYREELKQIVADGAGPVMVCANPDIQVRVGETLVWCAGALAAIYEELGGQVIYPGKPHAAIYDLAYAKAATLGDMPDKSRILAIGDGPITDMAGANREGIDCLYVGTGLSNTHGDFATETARLMMQSGVSATYAMAELSW